MTDEKQTPETPKKWKPISKEAAKKLFDDVLEFYDVDPEDLEEDAARSSHRAACKRVVRAVAKGQLEIREENSFPIFYLSLRHAVSGLPPVLRIREIDGAAKRRTKELSANPYGRMYDFTAGLTNQPPEDISRMIGQDLSIIEALSAIFLGV